MKKKILILILAINGLFSCKENRKPTSKKTEQSQKTNVKDIYTEYKYVDSNNGTVTLQNSLPKGGMKYTDVNGEVYSYVVFWTRIINQTDKTLELNINFPLDSFEVPSLSDKYFKILLPSDSFTLEKAPLFLYGLTDLESFLDKNIHKQASLNRIIKPTESNGLYFVMLCLSEGAKGTLRREIKIKDGNLYYRIKVDGSNSKTKSSDKEILCGSINLKNLVLQK